MSEGILFHVRVEKSVLSRFPFPFVLVLVFAIVLAIVLVLFFHHPLPPFLLPHWAKGVGKDSKRVEMSRKKSKGVLRSLKEFKGV